MLVFSLISLFLVLPQIAVFTQISNDNFDASALFKMTLANSGFSYVSPYLLPLSLNHLQLKCENSYIEDFDSISQLQQYVGLIPEGKLHANRREISFTPS